ncbi:uncharacterized protein [Procambarus clarkii]|uniref:uncharacterized protein n=1 Tax=Procambarus clarkii TaxID=6728 RepID=UPI0037430619
MTKRFVRKKLLAHLERRDLITHHHHEFKDGKSCLTGLIEFNDQATSIRLEREGWAESICLDYQNVFANVPFKRMLHKWAKQAEVTGRVLQWIREYQNNRKQRVTTSGESPECRDVTSGFPQTFVHGPILSLEYVNDLPEEIGSFHSMFAYDDEIMRRIKTQEGRKGIPDDFDKLNE